MSAPLSTPAAAPSNGGLIRRLLGLTWRYRLGCIKVLSIQLVLLTMGLLGLSLTGLGIDYIRHQVQGGPFPQAKFGLTLPQDWPPLQVIALLAGIILLLALGRALLNYAYLISINILLQQQLVVDLRAVIYDKLQQLSFRFFDANSTGSIITRVTGDVQSVRMFLDQVLFQSVIMAVSLTVYIIYMASLSPGLTLACLATTPLLAAMSLWFSKKIQPAYAQSRTLVEKMVQYLAESIQGIAVTKGFGREAENRAQFDTANRAVYNQQLGIFWRVSLFSPAVGILTRVNMIVLLSYGGWLVIHGRLPLGTGLIVFAGLLEQFSGQVNNIAGVVNSVQQSLIGARRVFEVMDATVEVKSAPDAMPCPKLKGAVRFERVEFSYSGIDPVLRGINLDVTPGQCVAILGATGAGKSVLMSLIPRFYDVTAGRLLVAASTCCTCISMTCAATSVWCSRRAFSFPTRSRPTSPSVIPMPRRRRSRKQRASPRRTTSSCSCRRATTPCSARAATRFPGDSGSAWPSRALCCSSRRSCCSMTRPRRSTARRSTRFSRRWTAPSRAARRSSSPTGSARSAAQILSS